MKPARGASPLTRGKLALQLALEADNGRIPAHAGKTSVDAYFDYIARAHPRSRGENFVDCCYPVEISGASPLTRGKPFEKSYSVSIWGRIPAHAGKTEARTCCRGARRAHPRSRGENSYAATIAAMFAGASPLTRGKRHPISESRATAGRIPAHAGKTASSASSLSLWRAHPRSRGENCWPRSINSKRLGASPLTRGKRISEIADCTQSGRIPAHAGKTCSRAGPTR